MCDNAWSTTMAVSASCMGMSYSLIMPRCACASEVYGSVFVCLCVCLCRVQLLKDQRSASKGFYRLLVMFSWILTRGFAK